MSKIARSGKYVLFAVCLVTLISLCATAFATDVIIETDHVWGSRIQIAEANCTEPARFEYTCSLCGAKKVEKEGATNPNAHQWGEWILDSAATCTSSGTRHRVCALNVHHTESQTIGPLEHSLIWEVTKAATCTTTGSRRQYCTVCKQQFAVEEIPLTGHTFGPWTTLTEPSCIAAGTQSHTCTVCGFSESSPYGSPLGHSWGAWITITPATCTTPGSEKRECIRCGIEENRQIPVLGHNWGNWVTIKVATCNEPGTRTRTCQRDASHVETETIPATGHKWGPWVVTKQATFYEEGERTSTCTVCGQVRTEKIHRTPWPNATVCAFGPRLKESNLYPYSSDRWYMYTPFDASVNGTQTFELVASDALIVGEVTLNIRDGYLTIDYTLKGGSAIRINLEFFTVLNRIGDLSQYEPENLMYLKMNRNQPINLAETFGDDTRLVLYFCSRAYVEYSPAFSFLQYDSAAHKSMLAVMLSLMD